MPPVHEHIDHILGDLKEAVLSSMIEGIQSWLFDLLLFELDQGPGVPLDDVREVSNYVAALHHRLHLPETGLPISLRLFREIHGVLLTRGRGKRTANITMSCLTCNHSPYVSER